MTSWRDEPMTEAQQKLIAELMAFTEFPLPDFNGKTKGEASDWLDQNLKKAHETLSIYETSHT